MRREAVLLCVACWGTSASVSAAEPLFRFERQGFSGKECRVACPVGYFVIGGGFRGARANISTPDSKAGWFVSGDQTIDGSGCHAVCMKASSPMAAAAYSVKVTAPGMARDQTVIAWCKADDLLIAGGWAGFVAPHTATLASNGPQNGFMTVTSHPTFGTQPSAIAVCAPNKFASQVNLPPKNQPVGGHCRAACPQGYVASSGGHEGAIVKHADVEPNLATGAIGNIWMFHPAPPSCRAMCIRNSE